MNYVFFDIECANCLNGEGKICSFGYVLTDEHFNVLKKKDILVDPDARFLLGNARTGEGIKLAYPLFKFRRAYKFPRYYNEIKRLLEDKNNISFGFAVHQDVSYILYTCKRYSLEPIDFSFYDVQKLEKELYFRKDTSGLDHLVEQFNIESSTYHRSDDDALMTMEVLREILKDKNLTVSDILEKYDDCLDYTKRYQALLKERAANKEKKKIFNDKVKYFQTKKVVPILADYDKFYWKKNYFFTNKLLSEHIDELLQVKEEIEKRGATIVSNPYESDVIIIQDKKTNDTLNLDSDNMPHIIFVTYDAFIRHLKYNK